MARKRRHRRGRGGRWRYRRVVLGPASFGPGKFSAKSSGLASPVRASLRPQPVALPLLSPQPVSAGGWVGGLAQRGRGCRSTETAGAVRARAAVPTFKYLSFLPTPTPRPGRGAGARAPLGSFSPPPPRTATRRAALRWAEPRAGCSAPAPPSARPRPQPGNTPSHKPHPFPTPAANSGFS